MGKQGGMGGVVGHLNFSEIALKYLRGRKKKL